MLLNDAGYALLKRFEGCVLTAYRDQGGTWTIGYGYTRDVHEGETWSQEQAEAKLIEVVTETENDLLDMIEPDLNDNQFSALVCLAYNIGSGAFEGSSALMLINEHRLADVPAAMKRWNKVRINGVLHVSRGLLRRRAAEVALWNIKD